MSAQLSLKYLKDFDLKTENEVNTGQFEMKLSCSNNLLALFNQSDIFIYNTSLKQTTSYIAFNSTSLLIDITDQYIYLSNLYSLIKFDLNTGQNQTIIKSDRKNQIKFITYSPDFKYIYFINQSSIHYYSPYLQLTNPIKLLNTTDCPSDRFFVDPYTQTMVSSSFDCKLCSFGINKDSLQFKNRNSIDHCRIGNANFMNGYLTITQDTIITKQPQIILVSLSNLNIISYFNQSSQNLWLQMTNINNYIMSYGTGDSLLWIYKDSIVNSPQSIDFSFPVLRSSFNGFSNQVYMLYQNQNSFKLSAYQLTFNCSSIANTNLTSYSQYTRCICNNKMLFDSSTQTCKSLQCDKNANSMCNCPSKQSFHQFSVQCKLNCSSVYNSFAPISYGNPDKCSCNYPFEWNSQLTECSLIDCSLINHTSNPSISSSCSCQYNYQWNDNSLACVSIKANTGSQSSSSCAPIGLIIGGIFLLLIIILLVIMYYYKKCKKSPQDEPKTYEYPKDNHRHQPTPRPLFFRNSTQNQLRQLSPPETQIKLSSK